jgi:exonuclease SbcD
MVKILHLADIHLGMENYGKNDKSGINSRLLDFLKSFDCVIDYALNNEVEFVLFAGDAFKTREPTQTQQREFAKRIKKLSQAGIKVIMVIGNHDLPNASAKADSLNIYKTLEVDNVYISKKPEVLKFCKLGKNQWELADGISIPGFANECFQVATLPWFSRSHFLGGDEFKNKNIDESNRLMGEKIFEVIENLKRKIDDKNPAVMVAHATVAGAEFGAERKVYVGSDIVVPLKAFIDPWKYTALGHLHKHQVLADYPPVVYAGSIDRVDFSEEKEDKGFVVAEIFREQKTKFKFIKVPARRFISIKVELNENCNKPTEFVINKIKNLDISEAVIKVILKVPENISAMLNNAEILKALNNAHYVASISREIIKEDKVTGKDYENIESYAPLDALAEFLKAKGVKAKKMQEYKLYAQKIIDDLAQEQ